MSPNEYLWYLPNHLGSWFWLPMLAIGCYGLFYLYRLAPAQTMTGRVIRVMLVIGFVAMSFAQVPFLNGLGPWAFYMLGVSVCLMVRQQYQLCLAAGKIHHSQDSNPIKRMAAGIHEHQNGGIG